MTFSQELLHQIQESTVLRCCAGVQFHTLGHEIFQMEVDGKNVLLTKDAGLDLAYRLAEFLASMEEAEGQGRPA